MNWMLVRCTVVACSATLVLAATAAPQRAGASAQSEFAQAAANAKLANEAFVRSDRLMMDWLTLADPRSGLLPRNTTGDRDIWNAKDCAADLYPFLVLTAWFTRPELYEGRMQEMLLTETALTARIGRLPDTYSFSKQGFAEARIDTAAIMFGASEYVKDGLMPITELLGVTPWRARMLGIVDDLWRYAPVETRYGRIVSLDPEVNGDMLLVLSRLYWMTRDARYLEYATRLGDYYLLGCASSDARLRDAAAARPRQRGDRRAHGAVRHAAEGAAAEGGGVSRADPRDARPHPRGRTERGRPVLQLDRSAGRQARQTRASPTTSATC